MNTKELEFNVRITEVQLGDDKFYRAVIQAGGERVAVESKHISPGTEPLEREHFFQCVGILLRRKYQKKFELGETVSDKAWREHPELIS